MGNQACCTSKEDEKLEAVENSSKSAPPEAPVVEQKVIEAPTVQPSQPKASTTTKASDGEFEIILDKTDGTRLGCDVDHEDGKTLVVDAITGSGLITQWNEANPDKALKPGDRIVEVNGHRGDVLRLVDECKQCKVLRVFVQRDK